MAVEIVPFEPQHLRSYEPGEMDLQALEGVDLEKAAFDWWDAALSVMDGDAVLAITGVSEIEGRPVGWFLGSDEIRRRPVTLHRGMRHGLDWLREHLGLDSLDVEVLFDNDTSARWLRRLGFVQAGMINGNLRLRKRWQ